MSVYDMNSFIFEIPDFIEVDWQESIDDADGLEKELLATWAGIMKLHMSIKDRRVTPALLAWINLWTKCQAILEGAKSAYNGGSLFTLDLLDRVALENWLHVFTILEQGKNASGKNGSRLCDGLCAYTAWALAEDKRLNWELSKKSMVDMVWDPHPGQQMKFDPKARSFHEAFIGDVNIDTDPDSLRFGRKKFEEHLRGERNRLDAWLKHPDLSRWIQLLNQIREEMKPQSVPFYALFNIAEKSIGKKMRNAGLGLGYYCYNESSSLIHGSTIEQFNVTSGSRVIPKLFILNSDIESKAETIRSTCAAVGAMLSFLQQKIWQSETAGN